VYDQISQSKRTLTRTKLITVLMLNKINKLFYVVLLGLMRNLAEYEKAQEFTENVES
jgi:hypothetical protein